VQILLPLVLLLGCWAVTGSQPLYAQQLAGSATAITAATRLADAAILLSRLAKPTDLAVSEFRKAGMQGVTSHMLTPEQRQKIKAALASLPDLNRHVLALRLHALAFVDGIPGEGTGLTSPAAQAGMYDITLRASVIDESLSQFLTVKESRVFFDDGSGTTVKVTGIGTDALTYVLLHESSHVVDRSCGITNASDESFDSHVWKSRRDLLPGLAVITPKTYFRGGSPLPASQAPSVYDSLAKTPFVSLYATASRQEDFAELVAWHNILEEHNGDLIVAVRNARGDTRHQWHPLSFPRVQSRFAQLNKPLVARSLCRGLF
jgi:hypothetical protein